jgi:hypothetical protein
VEPAGGVVGGHLDGEVVDQLAGQAEPATGQPIGRRGLDGRSGPRVATVVDLESQLVSVVPGAPHPSAGAVHDTVDRHLEDGQDPIGGPLGV